MPRILSNLSGSITLDEIVGVMGWDTMLLFARAFGGQRQYIPENAAKNSKLVAALGDANAQKLCYYFHRREIYVPVKMRREIEIRALAATGMSARHIADRLMVSYRHVEKVLARPAQAVPLAERQAPAQASFFSFAE